MARHRLAPRAHGERGFTLVELMVVLTVIAVAGAALVWALPDPQGRLADEATRFAARAHAARDLAIVNAQPVGVRVDSRGYGIEERVAGAWRASTTPALRPAPWGRDTRVVFDGAQHRIVFDPTGGTDDPAILRLSRGSVTTAVVIDAAGRIRVVR